MISSCIDSISKNFSGEVAVTALNSSETAGGVRLLEGSKIAGGRQDCWRAARLQPGFASSGKVR